MSSSSNKPSELAQSWITNAELWTAAVRDGDIESRRLVTDQSMVNAVLAQQPRRVLDLGCGEGWLVRALARHGVDCVGVDGSPGLIEAARSLGGGRFHVCTYSELVDDARKIGRDFDVVSVNFAILHEDVAGLLRALRPLLAPRGRMVMQTVHPWLVSGPYLDGWRNEDFRDFPGTWQSMPWYFRTLGSWVALFRDCGYSIIELTEPRHPSTELPLSLLVVVE